METSLAQKLMADCKKNKCTKLDLGYCGLTEIPEEVFELTWLEELYLCNSYVNYKRWKWRHSKNRTENQPPNKLNALPNGLSGLQNLKILFVGGGWHGSWNISDISCIQNLSQLQSLNLLSNNISDISSLKSLTQLQSLYLRNNNISDINSLKSLTSLQSLDLRNNNVSDISSLKNLTQLQSLYLSFNNIFDIFSLQNLTQLQSLNLRDANISDISSLKTLTSLQSLDLRENDISDISSLKNLNSLQSLDLSDNNISDINSLKNLTQLQSLYLRFNQQLKDFSILSSLEKLTKLILNKTNLTDLTPFYTLLRDKGLRVIRKPWHRTNNYEINVENCPLISPPVEIIKQGHEAILKYFVDIDEQGKDYLYEAKLLIVGEGESGKTTLAWKLKDLNSVMPEKEKDRTEGIDVTGLEIPNINLPEKSFRMNVWDFGGQEIYHATHQFFLTKRSLYLIVNNTRVNATDFNHWLQMISLFSENSPVIIVQNEVASSSTALDLRGLQQHFDNILYVRDTDLSKTDGRLQKLIRDIHFQIQQLDHVGSELPKSWVAIRRALDDLTDTSPTISDKEFYALCRKHKVTKKEAMRRIGGFLHDLGVFLHFQDDAILSRLVILQNSWATKGVYKILDNKQIEKQSGHFSSAEAQSIWDNTPFEDYHHELLQLMSKFELCYRIPYQQPAQYVSSQLLPKEKPAYNWGISQNLRIYYDYEFMPKGLMGRLIVRLYRYIKDIKTLAWRAGCIFFYENTDAQVVETYGSKKVEIRIKGPRCTNLATIIVKEIDELNAGFKQLKVKKMIPCNCSTCEESEQPEFYDYQKLLSRQERGRRSIECDKSFQNVHIQEILDGVYEATAAKEKSIADLVKHDKLVEALQIFEATHPNEAILLHQKYQQGKSYFMLGLGSEEAWSLTQRQIAHSLLKLSKKPPSLSSHTTAPSPSVQEQLITIQESINQGFSATHESLTLIQNLTEDNVADIFDWLTVAFKTRHVQELENFAELEQTFLNIKKSSNWEAKLKLAVPLIHHLGVKIETETKFDLKQYITQIKDKTLAMSIKYGIGV